MYLLASSHSKILLKKENPHIDGLKQKPQSSVPWAVEGWLQAWDDGEAAAVDIQVLDE